MPNEIRAVTEDRGSFKQGGIVDLLLKITDFAGIAVDPTYIECSIAGPVVNVSAEEVIKEGTPFQVAQGYYVYEWDIPDEQEIGQYVATWTYIADGETKQEIQNIYVVEEVDNPLYYSDRNIAFRMALEKHLSCAQSIPIYYEQSKPSRDRRKFFFTFPRWNQSAGVRVYRNKEIVNSGVEVDFFRGSITFDNQLLDQEIVNCDYNFKWFSEEDLDRFLWNAVLAFSAFPPVKEYHLDDIPNIYVPAILYGATKDALRKLMLCITFQQPAQVFGGPEAAKDAFSNLETLKKNYESDWERLTEEKKKGPYPKGWNIVVPEYTLPGGRSRWFRYLFG